MGKWIFHKKNFTYFRRCSICFARTHFFARSQSIEEYATRAKLNVHMRVHALPFSFVAAASAHTHTGKNKL